MNLFKHTFDYNLFVSSRLTIEKYISIFLRLPFRRSLPVQLFQITAGSVSQMTFSFITSYTVSIHWSYVFLKYSYAEQPKC